jgi:hypothetical protein
MILLHEILNFDVNGEIIKQIGILKINKSSNLVMEGNSNKLFKKNCRWYTNENIEIVSSMVSESLKNRSPKNANLRRSYFLINEAGAFRPTDKDEIKITGFDTDYPELWIGSREKIIGIILKNKIIGKETEPDKNTIKDNL